jgi:nucleoside-diphosphate-sugar epimerase
MTLEELIERLEKVSGLEAVIAEDLEDPVPLNYVTDLGRITQELDWKPETAIEDGLRTLF